MVVNPDSEEFILPNLPRYIWIQVKIAQVILQVAQELLFFEMFVTRHSIIFAFPFEIIL
jgi:hypothetical protein